MNFALKASLLIAVDAYAGEWLTLPRLVARVVRPMHEVESICDELVATGQMQADRMPDGTRCFGVQCQPLGGAAQ
ncbi:hypothetical protein ABXN37_28770 [Piscinibacter sakaiensis]|uniref:hypothetical protein n=2 Tax=Piscinibacter sakaiensis TaxID=1547922 RepID=UPI00372AB9D8